MYSGIHEPYYLMINENYHFPQTVEKFGAIDILVSNAAVNPAVGGVLDVSYVPVFNLCNFFFSFMQNKSIQCHFGIILRFKI